MSDDQALLTRYAASRDPEAFSQLVRRYSALVFSVAKRAAGNVSTAEVVTQECFFALARQASTIRGSLPAWLHRVAFGVSVDGSVVVGDSGQQAFRWTQSGGIAGLGFLSGQTSSSAVDVSANGSVVVGSSSNPGNEQAFRWTQSGGMAGLGYLSVGSYSFSNAVSPDGSGCSRYGRYIIRRSCLSLDTKHRHGEHREPVRQNDYASFRRF
jgi:probable HAF family extracellular repeat protein